LACDFNTPPNSLISFFSLRLARRRRTQNLHCRYLKTPKLISRKDAKVPATERIVYPIDISQYLCHFSTMNIVTKITRTAALFRSNRSQAVRIPKDMEFPEGVKKVVITKEGDKIVISPDGSFWDNFFEQPGIDIKEPDDNQPYEVREQF
jgi:antitoxin VapB